jgi:hypothetical protein
VRCSERYYIDMRLDTEKAATAVMMIAIAGVGPACVALLLLL